MQANSVPSKKPEYGIIILGNAGTGKSYIGNMIIGYERFETDCRREAVTTSLEYHRINAGSSDLLIYNIPGLIESHQEEIDRNKREIIKAFEQSPMSVVIFVCRQVEGRPHPDDIITFKALNEAYKFSSKSLMFILNNIPSQRQPTYEGRFFTLLTKMLNPIPISLEDMFFVDTLNSGDNEKFSATRDRLLHFIAQHRESKQKMKANIIVQSNELRMLRETLKKQCLKAEENKQALEIQIKRMTEEYEAVKKDQEKRYQDMMFKLQLAKQQAAEEEKVHELASIELETLHKEKKTGLKGQCQQLWEKVEDEKGIVKKADKCYKIVRNELRVKYKGDEYDEENKQALEIQIKRMTEEYEAIRKDQEKRYQDMMFKLQLAKQQAAEEEKVHELASIELETLHKEKKTGLKGQCQQLWEKVEDEKGIVKKVDKCYKIVRNELRVKYKGDEYDEEKNFKTQSSTIEDKNERNEKFHGNQLNKVQKKLTKLCNQNSDSSLLRPVVIGAAAGAVVGGAAGAVVGGAAGGAAGVICGPCAIATAAAGAVAGTAVGAVAGTAVGAVAGVVVGSAMGAAAGATSGGISGAIVTLYRCRRK